MNEKLQYIRLARNPCRVSGGFDKGCRSHRAFIRGGGGGK